MKAQAQPGFFKRRLDGVRRLWGGIAGDEYDRETAALRPHLPAEDLPLLRKKMEECLDPECGEIVARARAAALGQAYLALDRKGREAFLRLLASDFDMEEEEVVDALAAWSAADSPGERRRGRRRLRAAVESPRVRILTRFNALPQGVKFLVDLRADLLPLARKDPLLGSLDDDLKGLLASWFDPGFLDLRRVSWDTATGALLEKFMAYEAVHPVESWSDLKDRLDYDRRYFAFFHPRMPLEPLIFVEVALVRELGSSIQALLDPQAPTTDPQEADTAIFYSISNAQAGLAGVSFGGFLIKRVMAGLSAEFSGLKTFATLSPLPTFSSWLEGILEPGGEEGREGGAGGAFLLPSEAKRLRKAAAGEGVEGWVARIWREKLWMEDPEVEKAVEPVFLRLAARYLAREKGDRERALDPVAHFHLSNGARLERLNWRGDLSDKGLAQSGGIMANYLYDGRKIDANHEAYRGRGRVAVSSGVRGLLKGG